MFIEEIRLTSFKGFQDFTLKCSPFTTLVGLNSRGKTSILQAVQLLYDILVHAFGRQKQPQFSNPPAWEADPSYGINRLNFSDPDALWLNKKTSEPCNISIKLSEGVEVRLEVAGRSRYKLNVLKDNVSIVANSINQPEHRKIIEDIFALRPIYVPPIGALSPVEPLLSRPELERQLDMGRMSECWRSNLFWLYNDGRKEDFDRVEGIVQRYLPSAKIRLPKLNHDTPPKVEVQFEEETIFDISTSGGGLRTLLNLATIMHFSQSQCLLLDEPDAHLHSSLQKDIARMLLNYAAENDVQIFAATHAPDFIAEVPVESLVWIDRAKTEGIACSGIGRFLIDLGAITKAEAIRAFGADKILFVEGSLDRGVLTQLIDCSGKKNPFKDGFGA